MREAGAHEGATYFELERFCRAAAAAAAAAAGPDPAAAAAAAAAAEGRVTVEDGLWAVAVGVAAQRSIAEGGRPVPLAEVVPPAAAAAVRGT